MDDIIDINTLFGPLPVASNDLPVQALLELMHKHAVGTACTLSTLGLLLDPAIGNAVTRATCSENAVLLPVATLNPTLYFGDASVLMRLRTDGFYMARFFPASQGWPLDFAPFRALLRGLHTTHLPIMIDVERQGDITVLDHVIEDYAAPVILAGVSINMLSEAIAVLRHQHNWYVETSRLLAPGGMRQLVDILGAERLLFGTGAPSRPIASVLYTLQYAGLPLEAQRMVTSGNARRILHLTQ